MIGDLLLAIAILLHCPKNNAYIAYWDSTRFRIKYATNQ
jgi:hypothetical protein